MPEAFETIATRQRSELLFEAPGTPLAAGACFTTPTRLVAGFSAIGILGISDQPFTIEVLEACGSTGPFAVTESFSSTLDPVSGFQVACERIAPCASHMQLRICNTGAAATTVLDVCGTGIPKAATGTGGGGGAQGIQGPQGFQGFQGISGEAAAQGAQGFQGFQGLQGPQGFQGNQGSEGPQGFQGSQGFQGFQGPQGSQGVQGSQGNQGNQGDEGSAGAGGANNFIFGAGTDGAVTIAANTTLGRPMYASSLTVNAGVTLTVGQMSIRVSGTLTNNGTIKAIDSNAGANATSATGGAGGASATNLNGDLPGAGNGGGPGANGGTAAGANSAAQGFFNSSFFFRNQNLGGTGGTGPSGAGGTSAAIQSGDLQRTPQLDPGVFGTERGTVFTTYGGNGQGLGGGGGGGDGANSGGGGGGGGAGGGWVYLAAVTLTNNGVIQAIGGAGGNGFTPVAGNAGGGGGGGGGTGGQLILIYRTLTLGTITLTGGAAGAGGAGVGTGTAGTSGAVGQTGTMIEYNYTTGAVTVT